MHDLDMSNNRANMAYIGKTPWHSLGQQLTANASIETWKSESGLSYDVNRAVVQYMNGRMHDFPGNDVLYRSDTGAPLGLVSDRYKIVQPGDVLEFYRDLCDSQGFTLETAGALKGGAIYWALARVGLETKIRGDAHQAFLLLSSSADGSRATDARLTDIRVVCANTLAMAMNKCDGVRTKHSTEFNAQATKQALGVVDFEKSWNNYADSLYQLQDTPINAEEARSFFADLLRPAGDRNKPRQQLGATDFASLLNAPVGAGVNVAATDKDQRAIRGLEDLVNSYYQAPGAVPGTAYGLVQGVTHYLDHIRGTSDDKRLTSSWFGQGATLKQTAYERAMAIGK